MTSPVPLQRPHLCCVVVLLPLFEFPLLVLPDSVDEGMVKAGAEDAFGVHAGAVNVGVGAGGGVYVGIGGGGMDDVEEEVVIVG